MRIACGTDIIEISRIKQSIEELGGRFLSRVYTEKEIDYCNSRGNSRYQHFAGRFAVKEAVFKAISSEFKDKYQICWNDIECLNDKNGRPLVSILGLDSSRVANIDVSISHCKEYAVASAVVLFLS